VSAIERVAFGAFRVGTVVAMLAIRK